MANIYEQVTERIITALEGGIIPWRKPWRGTHGASYLPTNYLTKRAYRGANVIILGCATYASSEWLTYKQAQEIGAQVRKGEKGWPIVFWGRDTKVNKDGKEESYGFARGYTVFNIEQCDGIPAALPFDGPAFEPIAKAQAIADTFFARPAAPSLHHGGSQAYYRPLTDSVTMPAPDSFLSPDGYYQTLYHEMTHATGIASRLNRDELSTQIDFGSDSYSREELVAEFGAAFLSAEAGTSCDALLDNSTAYIQNWMGQLRKDSRLAVQAAQRAQRAADYILGRTFDSEV